LRACEAGAPMPANLAPRPQLRAGCRTNAYFVQFYFMPLFYAAAA
jgi:hypothetical protein